MTPLSAPRRSMSAASLAVLALIVGDASAQHRDIFLATQDGGRLATIGNASVFDIALNAPFVDGGGIEHHWTTNPGFASLNPSFLPDGYAALPGSSDLSFSVLSFALGGLPAANLWYWDGLDTGQDGDFADDVAFSPVASGAAFRMYRGPVGFPIVSSGIADGSDSDQPGFVIGPTSSGGGLHIHPGYEVFGPDDTPLEEGVYLASIGLAMENLAAAEPLYLLLRTSEITNTAGFAAREWVNTALVLEDPQLGDFNADGVVDAADYTVWRDGLDTAYTDDDYDAWRQNYGVAPSPASAGAAQAARIPEPSSLTALASLGLLGAAAIPRSRSGPC